MSEVGIKYSKDKLFYEIDWEFVKLMAERMAMNKSDKYPVFNWMKPIDVKELNQALVRHFIEIQSGNYDDEQKYGHYLALACNSMMILYQLRTFGEDHTKIELDSTPSF